MPGPATDDQDTEPPDEPDAEPDIERIVVAGASGSDRRRCSWTGSRGAINTFV